jgi:hypothetical protein
MGSHRGGSALARVENRGGGGVLWRTRRSGGRRGPAAGWEGVGSGTAKPEERTTRGGAHGFAHRGGSRRQRWSKLR